MTRFNLLAHHDFPPRAVESVEVQVYATESGTSLIYTVTPEAALLLPPPAKPYRADDLWQTTCFELFVQCPDGGYLEFNLSPSGAWAAYAFEEYRMGMRQLAVQELPALDEAPSIWTESEGLTCFALGCTLGELAPGTSIALTAVIEEVDGTKSYWSLAHPPGAPDFHHAACFAARLPAPERA